MSLQLLDYTFTVAHLLIIGANLLLWIWPKTRKLHLYIVGATLFCWLILGIWYGIGYCPVTDWQWQIKSKLGEVNLPNSFVKYHLDRITGLNIADTTVDLITLGTFLIAIMYSIKLNFFQKSATTKQ